MYRLAISPPFLCFLASYHKYLGLQATNLSTGTVEFVTGGKKKGKKENYFIYTFVSQLIILISTVNVMMVSNQMSTCIHHLIFLLWRERRELLCGSVAGI